MTCKRNILPAIAAAVILAAPVYGQGVAAMGIHEYIAQKSANAPSREYRQLAALTDTSLLKRKMSADEMSDFIKATKFQTRMVYAYSSLTSGKNYGAMTPVEFVHSLTDDLFQRKALQHFVSKSQKEGLEIHRDVIDAAMAGKKLTERQLEDLVQDYITKTNTCRKESEYPD